MLITGSIYKLLHWRTHAYNHFDHQVQVPKVEAKFMKRIKFTFLVATWHAMTTIDKKNSNDSHSGLARIGGHWFRTTMCSWNILKEEW